MNWKVMLCSLEKKLLSWTFNCTCIFYRKNKGQHDGRKRKSRFDSPPGDVPKKASKTLAGATAGLSSANQMKAEAAKMRAKEDRAFGSVWFFAFHNLGGKYIFF